MKTVLVTGADGQLARCIKDLIQNCPKRKFIFKNAKELDITNKEVVFQTFKKHNFDYCINCAAYTNVENAEIEVQKAESVNTYGPKYLAEVCNINNTVLFHISTDFVFDGSKETPYLEIDTTNPINSYGLSKLNGENEIIKAHNKYFIIRTSWLYSEYGNNFLKTMLRLSKIKKQLEVVNDQIGSPTYAKHLAEVILKIIDSKKRQYGVYHYSNLGETSWFGFAKVIFELWDITIKIKGISTSELTLKAERPKYSVLNGTKIQSVFALELKDWKKALTELSLRY